MNAKEKKPEKSLESRTSQAGQDYFEQVGGNVFTGPVYMQGQSEQGTETIRPKVFHNLPQPDYGNFVGRETELSKITRILRPYPYSQHSVVTIDGIGGIGKSALALEIAHQYLHNYDQLESEDRFDAIIWMSAKQTVLTAEGISTRRRILHTLNDIYTAIAVALQREDITRASVETQDEVVRNALTRQRTLLIVDNLETIDDEAVLDFLRELPAPTKAIVTTRHRIDVAYPVRLTGMPWEDGRQLILQETEKKEVELDEDSIRRLYDRTGGVPLAIVWSIAQMGFGYNPEAVLTRLGQPTGDIARFCFEGAIARIKNKPAHKLLMVLSLCADSASREALGYATELPELDRGDGLVELEKLSLVNKKGDRFWLLPLTKQFALAEFQKSPDKEHLRGKWVEYFKTLSEEYDGKYWYWANYEWLLAEKENIFAIINWSIINNNHEIVLSFTHAAQRYFTIQGRWTEMLEYGEKFSRIAHGVNDKATLAWLNIRWLAPLHATRGDLSRAEFLTRQSVAIYQELQDVKGMCFALNGLGRALRGAHQYEAAEATYRQAMDLAQQHNDGSGIASVHFELGKLARNLSKWEDSKIHWEAVIQWCQEHKHTSELDVFTLWGAIAQLGWVEFLSGNYTRGKELIEQSLAFFETMLGKGHIIKLKRQLAQIENTLGNREKAIQYLQEALFWAERLNLQPELQKAQALLQELQGEPKQPEDGEDEESA